MFEYKFLPYSECKSKALITKHFHHLNPSCCCILFRVCVGLRNWIDVFPSISWVSERCFEGRVSSLAKYEDNFLSTGWLTTPLEKLGTSMWTLEITAIGVKAKVLKSHNTSTSQCASAVRSGGGVLSGIRGLKQPPTSCLWQLTREQVSVHSEWLFQPPHLDARAELEQKWIDSLFHPAFINSEGLEAQWPRSFNYFSAGQVTIIAKELVMVLIPIQGQSYDTLCLIIWSCARQVCLCKCKGYSLNSCSISRDKGECQGSSPVFWQRIRCD